MSPQREIRDVAASVRARLLNIARQHHIDFNRVLLIYLQQCFLERLANSRYKDKFILKGGLLFYGVEQLVARPTKDIDLLGRGIVNQPDKVEAVMQEILAVELPDGVRFQTHKIRSEKIAGRRSYSGVRVFVPAELGQARQNLQIDVGFGDTVIPEAVAFDYPALLRDGSIKIYAYSWCSVIAEKYEAIVSFSDLISRMKDFYDIYYLQNHFNFNGSELSRAIRETFSHRGTKISESDYVFSEGFAHNEEKRKQWGAFLRKNNLTEPEDFPLIVDHLKQFLMPVVSAIIQQAEFNQFWDCQRKRWYLKKE